MVLLAIPLMFISGLLGALVTFPWRNAEARNKLPILAVLLIPPAVAFLWGQIFVVEPGTHPHPDWMAQALLLPICLSLLLPPLLIGIRRTPSWFTLSFGLMMLGPPAFCVFCRICR